MTLNEILVRNAARFPDKTALAMRVGYRTVSLSYRDVHEIASRTAGFLRDQGVAKGDRVMVLAPNSPDWICLFWGVLLRGAVLVPLNLQSTAEMVRQIATQSGAKLLFKHRGYKATLPPGVTGYDLDYIHELPANLGQQPEITETDLAEIVYTSGTTGQPKGVMLTHGNLSANAASVSQAMPMTSEDVFLSILPLSHVFEQVVGFLYPFQAGGKIVYAHSPTAIPELLREHHVTTVVAVPEFLRVLLTKIEERAAAAGKKEMFHRMLALAKRIESRPVRRLLFGSLHRRFGGKLGRVASGGAPLDSELERAWNAMGFYVLQGYGLTETSPVVSTNTEMYCRSRSVGKVVPGVTVRRADDGEVLVQGPNVFRGYYGEPALTATVFTDDGWFKTGDIGELDSDGYLFLKGRKKYMILGPGGQNVYPEDVEAVLNKLPGMKDSCVVGWERRPGQEEIHAVLLGANLDADAVVALANEQLACYQRITGWSVWPEDDFPRAATRKVKKDDVLQWLKSKERPVAKPAARLISPLVRLVASLADAPAAEITETTDILRELPFDSLLRVELLAGIERDFGVELDDSVLGTSLTIAKLEEFIRKAQPIQPGHGFKKWPITRWARIARCAGHKLAAFPLGHAVMDLRVEGVEHLQGLALPAVFMANHLSFLDSLAFLMALPPRLQKQISFAAARDVVYGEYRHVSWLAELLFNSFPFPRHEGENIKAGLDYFGRMLDRGWSVMIYPEGQMSLTGELQPLKRGAGLIATEMNCPVVPVYITGTNVVMPHDKILPRKRSRVTVRFGSPQRFSHYTPYVTATEQIYQALRTLQKKPQ
jgi:long-chain acyl-CoA synthetase